MRVLVKYYDDYGRMGDLEALFVTSQGTYTKIVESDSFYVHDVLGKHSEVEVYPHKCTVILTETPETKEVFDILEAHVSVGIAYDLVDHALNPDD